MNDDTIKNLISYGDENSENTAENKAENTPIDTDGDTRRIELPKDAVEDEMQNSESENTGDTIRIDISNTSEQNDASAMNNSNDTSKNSEDAEEDIYDEDDEEAFEADYVDYEESFPEEDELPEEEYGEEEYDELYDEDDDGQLIMPKRQRLIIGISGAVLLALFIVFTMTDTGVIGNYKKNVSANVTKIFSDMGIDISKKPVPTVGAITDTSAVSEDVVSDDGKREQIKIRSTSNSEREVEYDTEVDFSKMIPIESTAEADFCAYKKGVLCARTNHLSYIGASGEVEWEVTTSVVDPMLEAEGDYILLAQKSGKKICMYNGERLLYDTDTEGNILSCAVSTNGDAVLVMSKQAYKGAFSVYNKDGDEIYAWSSGSDIILSADISNSSRRVAASLMNTDGRVKSTIMLFNIKKEDSYASAEFDDTVLFDVVFVDENINAFGDNAMVGMNTSGRVLYDKRFDDVELTNYSIDTNGTKIMVFRSGNIPMMNIYNSAGVLKYTVTLQSSTDHADISSYNIIYNDKRDVILGKPNSRHMSKFTATMDIKKLVIIDSRTFAIVYSNSLEFVRM